MRILFLLVTNSSNFSHENIINERFCKRWKILKMLKTRFYKIKILDNEFGNSVSSAVDFISCVFLFWRRALRCGRGELLVRFFDISIILFLKILNFHLSVINKIITQNDNSINYY